MPVTNPLLFRVVCLLLCGSAACAASTATVPATTAGDVEQAAVPDDTALSQRVAQATQQRETIRQAAEQEDAPRGGHEKTLKVQDQLKSASELAAQRLPTAPYQAKDVEAYEAACRALEAAYLDSLLESTDPASIAGPFRSDGGRDLLGSATVDAKLKAWQEKNPARPFVKFAIVRSSDGKELEVHVGAFDVGHVDIAGGPALSAGLLQTTVIDGKTKIVVLENTSGGFRPGPLRNLIAKRAIEAASYLPDGHDLTVHDNPSGGYDHSKLVIPTKR